MMADACAPIAESNSIVVRTFEEERLALHPLVELHGIDILGLTAWEGHNCVFECHAHLPHIIIKLYFYLVHE